MVNVFYSNGGKTDIILLILILFIAHPINTQKEETNNLKNPTKKP